MIISTEIKDNWNLQNHNFQSSKVIEISLFGCVSPKYIDEIFQNFTSLKNLSIVGSDNITCKIDKKFPTIKNHALFLNNLTYLSIHNTSNYVDILNLFSNNYKMPSVIIVDISNVNGNHENVLITQRFMKNIRYSLEILNFSNITWESSPFQNFGYSFLELYKLKMDFICQSNENCQFIAGLDVITPKLKNLLSNQGYLLYSNESDIFKLKSLETLELNFIVPNTVKVFDVSNFKDELPALNCLHLYLNFQDLQSCKIVGKRNDKYTLEVSIHSNCYL